jgi:hypothetical protein
MEIHHWVSDHGFDLLEAIGIIASLTFTAVAFLRDAKSRRIDNLIALTAGHRDLWKELLGNPGLKRVLDPQANFSREPVTQEESVFVTLLIQHLHAAFQAMNSELTVNADRLRWDVRQFFSYPIPRTVWTMVKTAQNEGFMQFVDSCLGEPTSNTDIRD